jgi:U6 snRNA phosphodiesterase
MAKLTATAEDPSTITMPLSALRLAYDSSGDEDGDDVTLKEPPTKKRKLPGLSNSLVIPTPEDNPALHQGRTRSAPYIEGQWAAYVYVPIVLETNTALRNLLIDMFNSAKDQVPTLHAISPDLVRCDDGESGSQVPRRKVELHLSLSRPIYLRSHQRHDLKRVVEDTASNTLPYVPFKLNDLRGSVHRTLSRFTASFATIAELTNDERTRTFLALEVGAGHDQFKTLSDRLTPILEQLRQQKYYTQPRFHASFAWALLDDPNKPINLDSVPPKETHKSAGETSVGNGIESDDLVTLKTVPSLPSDLVSSLVATYGSRLTNSKTGGFGVDKICVRIGKDVTTWKLNTFS